MLSRRRSDLEAREFAQMLLGAVSLILWFAVAFGLAIAWQVNDDTPAPRIMLAGGIGCIVAALPWLGYRRLVAAARGPRPTAERGGGPAPRG
jgi:hypothetical protein